jgi:SAM-dependent methyltransferase
MLAPLPPTTAHKRVELLTLLYRDQLQQTPGEYLSYLSAHSEPGTIAHHVNAFEWYLPYLTGARVVLDWGCNHGPDSCLLRHQFGNAIDLHACDFATEEDFRVFRDYARPCYKQITDPRQMPYENDTFDVVIGSGVLEHTAMEGEALKEVYRILRPLGTLIITYLPYAYSWDEWYSRNIRKTGYHRRVFTRREFSRVLLSHGFEAQRIELQGFVPNKLRRPGGALGWLMMPALHRFVQSVCKPIARPLLYPFFRHSVLCGIARKMVVM